MAYIGVSPSNGVRKKHTYTATASQTSFSGAGDEGITLAYRDSNYVDVYQNGVKLADEDYTATSGTAIVLAQGASADDIVEIIAFDVFSVADTVSKADGGTFDGNVEMAGTLGVTGVLTGTSLDISGDIDVDGTANLDVVDIDGAVDMASTLAVTGAITGATAVFTQTNTVNSPVSARYNGSNKKVAFNINNSNGQGFIASNSNSVDSSGNQTYDITNTAAKIDFGSGITIDTAVSGSAGGTITYVNNADFLPTGIVFNEGGVDVDFRVESNGNANALLVDAGADNVLFGQASADSTANGAYFHLGANNAHLAVANTQTSDVSALLFLNRQGSDGEVVSIRHANSVEGTITISGATVTYNGFSGQHESSGIATNTAVGTVVSSIDELDTYPSTQSDTLGNDETHPKAGQTRADHPKVKISDTVGDACVYGVVAEFSKQDKVMIASVGIGSIRVTGACAKGDLLESNGDGTAKVQSDDIVRSKTIGKVTIGNSTTDVKLVSCVLYCG